MTGERDEAPVPEDAEDRPEGEERDPGATVAFTPADGITPTVELEAADTPAATELAGTLPARTEVEPDAEATPATPSSAAGSGSRPKDAAEGKTSAKGARIAGRYEVVKKLGEGGMGRVFHVRDLEIQGRELALKVLRSRYSKHPRFRELFFTEVKAAQQFVHEQVNQVRDTGLDPRSGELFMTMDLVAGESVRALLKRENQLTTRHALEIARQTLLGLQAGHEKGLVHRDVKPENLMLAARIPKTDDNPYGVGVRILDFGLAGVAAEVDEGKIAGTPMYMSPEQAQGQRLAARSDLFAVGVVLYEMIAGSRPFHGKTVDNILTSVLETDVAPLIERLAHLSRPVQSILKKALEKKRDRRFQSATEFIAAIEKSPAYHPPRQVSRFAVVVAALFAAVSLVGLFGYWTERDKRHDLALELENRQNAIDSLQDAAARLSNEKTNLVDANKSAMDRMLGDQEGIRAGYEATIAERDRVIADLTGRNADLRAQIGERDAQEGDIDVRVRTLEDRVAELRRGRDRAEQEATEATRRIRELEDRLGRIGAVDDVAFVGAKETDRMLRFLEIGRGARAREIYYSLRNAEIVETEGLDGLEFLDALTDGAEAMSELESAEDEVGRDQALTRARGALARAEASWETFPTLAAEWLDQPAADGSAADRRGRLEASMGRLQDALGLARASSATNLDDAWKRVVTDLAPEERDPNEVFRLAARFEDGREAEVLREYAAFLRERCEEDGVLRLEDVRSAGALDAWGPLVLANGLRVEPAGRSTLAFWFARRWYDGDATNDAFDAGLLRMPATAPAEPIADWEAELRLKVLLDTDGTSLAFGPDSRFLYLATSEATDDVTWQINTFVRDDSPPADVQRSWLVQLAIYNERGSRISDRTSRLLQFDRTYAEEGRRASPLLRLDRTGPGYLVATWTPGDHPETPNRLPILRRDVEAFRAAQAGGVLCLVVREGGAERWYSPDLGLVREVVPGGVSRELVHAKLVR